MTYDLIIVGGGPAGITAGIYAARKKLKTLLITKEWGGQITKANDIENWPGIKTISGPDLMENMLEHLKKFEIELKDQTEVIDLNKENNEFAIRDNQDNEYKSKTVIIATGKVPRLLNIPGEEEYKGKGVSLCSTCDAPMFKDKEVAVIGGGNAGFSTAYDLTKYATKVYILEFMEEMCGDPLMKEKIEKTGKAKFITNVAVKEIKGDDFVKSLIYENRDTGEDKEIEVQGVFIAIGMTPKAGFAENLVEFDDIGEIKIDRNNKTKTEGLFAAGDITDVKYEQIVIACGEGAKATLAVDEYLSKK
ncbi:MAG: FAD-binding protein [Candidatus Portnoybacteria bacterium]|nr:FAD-binding protein [Candidatus Portnoybacteria bacterium]